MPLLKLINVTKVYESDGGPVTALDDISFAVNEGEFGTGHLTPLRLAAQLPHRLDDVEHAARGARMGIGEESAVRVARQAAVQIERTTT